MTPEQKIVDLLTWAQKRLLLAWPNENDQYMLCQIPVPDDLPSWGNVGAAITNYGLAISEKKRPWDSNCVQHYHLTDLGLAVRAILEEARNA